MSSAKARMVEVEGRDLERLSRRMSMQRTKRVGDMGHPWRTPDLRVMDGKSSEPILSWWWLSEYSSWVALMKLVGTPMCLRMDHMYW